MKFYSELVIYCILIINTARVFLNKSVKQDSLVILAPVAFILSITQFVAYGHSIKALQLLGLSILIVFLNVPAFIRNRSKLFIDYYSIPMKISCGISLFLILLSLGFNIANREVTVSSEKLNISEKKIYYEGSFRNGFTEPEIFSERTAYFYEYKSNLVLDSNKNVVVFVSDKRGDSAAYKPYLQLLAANGYTVCTFDFYTEDCNWNYETYSVKMTRPYHLAKESVNNPEIYRKNEPAYKYNVYMECNAMLPMLLSIYGKDCKFFFVADGMADDGVRKLTQEHPQYMSGTFYLDSIPEYKTAGYGCVEMTNPYLAKRLGEKRDKDGFITKYLVLKTSNAIRDAWSGL
ncbi:MAG: hypothetical protein MJ179_03410 [Treponema sp.]|nr:hypothetical protein [Treponema sp.]